MIVEQMLGVVGRGSELRSIPEAELRSAFSSGDTPRGFVASLQPSQIQKEIECDARFKDWTFEIDSLLKPRTATVTTSRVKRTVLYEAFKRGINPATFVERISASNDLLGPNETVRANVPFQVWVGELKRTLANLMPPISIAAFAQEELERGYACDLSPLQFSEALRKQPSSSSAQPSGSNRKYAEWLDELHLLLENGRPDISPADLDPNACYIAWQSGRSPGDVATGVIPIRGQAQSQVPTSSASPNWKGRPQPMPELGFAAKMRGHRLCRCPNCNGIVRYEVGSYFRSALTLVGPTLWDWPREVQCQSCDFYCKTPFLGDR